MWIQTYSGKKFYPQIPKESDIEIRDIIQSLRQTCRFNGHTIFFYSVLQHSYIVHKIVYLLGGDTEAQLWGLIHDASEAYISDIPSPIKPYIFGLEEMESKIQQEVAKKFNVCYPMPEVVKRADLIALALEKKYLINPGPEWEQKLPDISGYDIKITERDMSKVTVDFETALLRVWQKRTIEGFPFKIHI